MDPRLRACCVFVLVLATLLCAQLDWASQIRSLSTAAIGLANQVRAPVEVKEPAKSIDKWCGKAYRAGDASFDPEGQLFPPPTPNRSALTLRSLPRYNLYIDGEKEAALLIDAELSSNAVSPFCDSGDAAEKHVNRTVLAQSRLHIVVYALTYDRKVVAESDISANSTGNEISIPLANFEPSFVSHELLVVARSPNCDVPYITSTNLTFLPKRTDGGSIVKLDNLYGGLLSYDSSRSVWMRIFSYGYYTNWGGYLAGNTSNLETYAKLGYNTIHPIPGGGANPWEDVQVFEAFLDKVEELGLFLMYDMRWTYQDRRSLEKQIEQLHKRKSLLLYYTADEPDGHGDPLNAPSLAYHTIRAIDPYHPISLTLNCQNFHYKDYVRGAEIILTDPYPIAVNTSFSSIYNTVCNSTYGCCGCDNCAGNGVEDVRDRLRAFQQYEQWIRPEGEASKVFWGVPQAFGGSEFWKRAPIPREEIAIQALMVNWGAKGLMAWTFPTNDDLAEVTSRFGRLLNDEQVVDFILGTRLERIATENLQLMDAIDVAIWRQGEKMLVSIVNMVSDRNSGVVRLPLGTEIIDMTILWPTYEQVHWTIDSAGLVSSSVEALEVAILLLQTN